MTGITTRFAIIWTKADYWIKLAFFLRHTLFIELINTFVFTRQNVITSCWAPALTLSLFFRNYLVYNRLRYYPKIEQKIPEFRGDTHKKKEFCPGTTKKVPCRSPNVEIFSIFCWTILLHHKDACPEGRGGRVSMGWCLPSTRNHGALKKCHNSPGLSRLLEWNNGQGMDVMWREMLDNKDKVARKKKNKVAPFKNGKSVLSIYGSILHRHREIWGGGRGILQLFDRDEDPFL